MQEDLDKCYSAYVDDILVYLEGSQQDYKEKVTQIVRKLSKARVHLDINKSKYLVKKIKYLRYIIKAGGGISIDLDKVAAIKAWETI